MTNLLIGYGDIVNKCTLTASPTATTGHLETALTLGGRRTYWKSGSAATSHTLTFDIGSGLTDSANYLFIARANMLTVPDATTSIEIQKSPDNSTWYSLLYNKPMIAANQAGFRLDDYLAALNSNDSENRFIYSEAMDTASSWVNAAGAVLSNPTSDVLRITEDGSTGAHGAKRGASTFIAPITSGVAYTASVSIKAGSRSKIVYQFNSSTTQGTLDLSNGTVSSAAGGTTTVIDEGSGWYRLSVAYTAASTSYDRFSIYLHNGTGTSYTGNSSGYVDMKHAQVRLTSASTAYVVTRDKAVYSGAMRYHRAIFTNVAGGNIQPACSKIMLCNAFDFGRDSTWGRKVTRTIEKDGQRDAIARFEIGWKGITEAKKTEFETEIGEYQDVQSLCLIAETYSDVLMDARAVHVRIAEPPVFEPINVGNYNVSIVFEELI